MVPDDDKMTSESINHKAQRYPYCIVWTPIPLLTWIFPFIGHMGIGMSNGVIRDFAASYAVGEGSLAFGKPTKYWALNPENVTGSWDSGVSHACEVYKNRMHNLCCDNCHSMVAVALNEMRYNNSTNWNMVRLAFDILLYGKYVSFGAFLKTNLPFFILAVILLSFWVFV